MTTPPKKVIVIGLGGIGTWLAHGLVRALEYQAPRSVLLLVDGDNFEPKNFERQNFTNMGNKAMSVRDDIRHVAPHTFVIGRAAWVVSEEAETIVEDDDDTVARIAAKNLMEEGDYVFCVVDNFATRKEIFDAAEKFDNIDVFTGGNDDRLFGSVIHYCRRDGQDVTLAPKVMHPEFREAPDRNPGEMSCQERAEQEGGTQLLAINMAVASMLLAKAAHIIFGTPEEKEAALQKAEILLDLEQAGMRAADRRPEPVLVDSINK